MNERLKELYKSCRPKEALASQEQYNSADILIGTEVAKFAELIIQECIRAADEGMAEVTMRPEWPSYHIKKHFGVNV